MNNEPVAWMNFYDRNILAFDKDIADEFPNDWIPLYTHPAKTLTDEEIKQIRKEIWDENKFMSEIFIDFARAILKKASEK